MDAQPLATELTYRPDDTAALFEAVADEPWSMLLDSGAAGSVRGRYDIIVADPSVALTTWGDWTTIERRDATERSAADPFALVRAELGAVAEPPGAVPFAGGALGYFGYDLARRLETLPRCAADAEAIPDMAIGVYDWALVVDHDRGRTCLAATGRDARTAARWHELVERFAAPPTAVRSAYRVPGEARANFDPAGYRRAFERLRGYLRAGDCYQVNLAQRFAVEAHGDPWAAFRRLRTINPAPFAAYLNIPEVRVLSVSPERFLQVDADGQVETRPIKGTRPRAREPEADRGLAESLVSSPKDRAENVMIVDLLRNDLGRVCRPGSVRVPDLFAIESFPTVHHLVSTITGELAPGHHALDLLRACFPGGSITGAPKVRAMEIIEGLEPHRRGVYCGSIGYIGFDGAMDTNIAIRTLVHSGDVARFWAGGGVVIDSEAEAEYQETFDKAAAMLALLREAADTGRAVFAR
jgi:para-aminobenzoate synthetase component 1